MDIAEKIKQLRESTGETRKEFSIHTGIPVRTLEDWWYTGSYFRGLGSRAQDSSGVYSEADRLSA